MSKRSPRSVPVAERAAILAYAGIKCDRDAAKQFGVTMRAIRRWRAAARDGTDPELADLVRQQETATRRKYADVLTETYELALRSLQARIPEMSTAQILETVRALGDLQITKLTLGGGDDDEPGDDSEDPSAPEAARRSQEAPGGAKGEEDHPVH